jgi:hypothetical protein
VGTALPCPQRRDQGQGGGEGHPGSHTAEYTGHDEDTDVGRVRRQKGRGDGEERSQQEHGLASVAVTEGPEVEDGPGQAEREADRYEVERGLRRPEGRADLGECHVRDGQVEVGHHGDEYQCVEHPARTLR